jgi:hypothetical protein
LVARSAPAAGEELLEHKIQRGFLRLPTSPMD